jgi:dTDP-4-dehydrorhamnose reductase
MTEAVEPVRGLVVGASGFVGRHLARLLGPQRCVATYHSRPIHDGVRFDARMERLSDLLPTLRPPITHVFILYGAIDMEGCARDPQGTAKINVDSVLRMIEDTVAYGARVVYVSTDYIFDGRRGLWREDDAAHPVMEYGRQKLAIETYLRGLDAPWLATRLSKVVGGETATHSMLGQWVLDIRAGRTMRCASDQIFSPAWVEDVAAGMIELAEGGHTGLVNLAGPTPYSRLGLLELLVSCIRDVQPSVKADIVPVSLHDMPFLEKRPLDTSLDTTRLRRLVTRAFTPMPELCRAVAREHFG